MFIFILTDFFHPTIVLEVDNSDSIPSLHDPSTSYFYPRTSIQIYLVIKLFPIRQDGTSGIGTEKNSEKAFYWYQRQQKMITFQCLPFM